MDAAQLDALLGASEAEREESWRYSRNALRAVTQAAFVAAAPDAALPAELRAAFDGRETRAARLVFVNGAFNAALSTLPPNVVLEVQATRATLRVAEGARLHLVYANVPG